MALLICAINWRLKAQWFLPTLQLSLLKQKCPWGTKPPSVVNYQLRYQVFTSVFHEANIFDPLNMKLHLKHTVEFKTGFNNSHEGQSNCVLSTKPKIQTSSHSNCIASSHLYSLFVWPPYMAFLMFHFTLSCFSVLWAITKEWSKLIVFSGDRGDGGGN